MYWRNTRENGHGLEYTGQKKKKACVILNITDEGWEIYKANLG